MVKIRDIYGLSSLSLRQPGKKGLIPSWKKGHE